MIAKLRMAVRMYRLSHTPFNTLHDLPFGIKFVVLRIGAMNQWRIVFFPGWRERWNHSARIEFPEWPFLLVWRYREARRTEAPVLVALAWAISPAMIDRSPWWWTVPGGRSGDW